MTSSNILSFLSGEWVDNKMSKLYPPEHIIPTTAKTNNKNNKHHQDITLPHYRRAGKTTGCLGFEPAPHSLLVEYLNLLATDPGLF